jgi:hypothetical protein
MKISATINDQEFDLIKAYIDCDQWANPMQDEFIFYNPTERFLLMLNLFSIEYHQGQ